MWERNDRSQDSNLSSFYHPSDDCSGGCAGRKRRHKRWRKVSMDAASRLIQEILGSIKTLLRGMLHNSHAILYRIGNCAGRARSLVTRFGNVVSCSFRYCL
jgi:hypothetical protein